MGEEGPELFRPAATGRVYSHGQTEGMLSQGEAPKVEVSVVNVTDPSELGSYLSSQDGQKVVLNVLRRNKNAAKQILE